MIDDRFQQRRGDPAPQEIGMGAHRLHLAARVVESLHRADGGQLPLGMDGPDRDPIGLEPAEVERLEGVVRFAVAQLTLKARRR